jgi:hypothetical protein
MIEHVKIRIAEAQQQNAEHHRVCSAIASPERHEQRSHVHPRKRPVEAELCRSNLVR